MLKDDTNQETGQDLTLMIPISFINVVFHKFVISILIKICFLST